MKRYYWFDGHVDRLDQCVHGKTIKLVLNFSIATQTGKTNSRNFS